MLNDRYEKYVSNLHFSEAVQAALRDKRGMTVVRVDYLRFRLFALSLLWRASVSSLDFFKDVKLNAIDEERLRSMLVRQDPGSPEDYGMFLVVPLSNGKPIFDRMLSPDFTIVEGNFILRFLISGIIWTFCRTRDNGRTPEFGSYFLNEDGNLHIAAMDESNLPMVTDLVERLHTSGKIKNAMEYLNRVSTPKSEKK